MKKALSAVVLALSLASSVPSLASARPLSVNVNTATETQLTYLPGIGDVLASRIVEWREGADDGQHKHITRLEQLLDVRGMGEARLARIARYVTFEGPTTVTSKIVMPRRKTSAPKH